MEVDPKPKIIDLTLEDSKYDQSERWVFVESFFQSEQNLAKVASFYRTYQKLYEEASDFRALLLPCICFKSDTIVECCAKCEPPNFSNFRNQNVQFANMSISLYDFATEMKLNSSQLEKILSQPMENYFEKLEVIVANFVRNLLQHNPQQLYNLMYFDGWYQPFGVKDGKRKPKFSCFLRTTFTETNSNLFLPNYEEGCFVLNPYGMLTVVVEFVFLKMLMQVFAAIIKQDDRILNHFLQAHKQTQKDNQLTAQMEQCSLKK